MYLGLPTRLVNLNVRSGYLRASHPQTKTYRQQASVFAVPFPLLLLYPQYEKDPTTVSEMMLNSIHQPSYGVVPGGRLTFLHGTSKGLPSRRRVIFPKIYQGETEDEFSSPSQETPSTVSSRTEDPARESKDDDLSDNDDPGTTNTGSLDLETVTSTSESSEDACSTADPASCQQTPHDKDEQNSCNEQVQTKISQIAETTPKEKPVISRLPSILRKASIGQKTLPSDPVRFSLSSIVGICSSQEEEANQSPISSSSSMSRLGIPSPQPGVRRSASEPSQAKLKKIKFDPRIWIREFERNPHELDTAWYTDQEMERFRMQTVALIMAQDVSKKTPQFMATGTTRTISRGRSKGPAFFTHQSLSSVSDEDDDENLDVRVAMQNNRYRLLVAQQEVQRILLVDPHDICVTLFRKAFKAMLPRAQIVGVASFEEALDCISKQSFDIILVEERLKPLFHSSEGNGQQTSGSHLFRTLSKISAAKRALWIGASAHLQKDRSTLEASGVDLCWSKPPPKLSDDLRNSLLEKLLIKRGRRTIARDLFGPLQV